jgi:hypothetical protein
VCVYKYICILIYKYIYIIYIYIIQGAASRGLSGGGSNSISGSHTRKQRLSSCFPAVRVGGVGHARAKSADAVEGDSMNSINSIISIDNMNSMNSSCSRPVTAEAVLCSQAQGEGGCHAQAQAAAARRLSAWRQSGQVY